MPSKGKQYTIEDIKLALSDIQIEDNKNIVDKMVTDLLCKDTSYNRIHKLVRQYCKLENKGIVSKSLTQFEVDDIKKVIVGVKALDGYYLTNKRGEKIWRTYSVVTKSDYLRWFKQFYNWYKLKDTRLDDSKRFREVSQFYDTVKGIKRGNEAKKRDRKSILTHKDFGLILEREQNLMYRAIFSLLFYNGLRIGGILNIKLKDIDMSGRTWVVTVTDKTGEGNVFVLEPKPYIVEYINKAHPNKKPDSFLFLSFGKKAQVRHASVSQRLKRIKTRIQRDYQDWNKPMNPHWFRHSWATRNRHKMPDKLFRMQGKWSLTSKIPNVYDHSNLDDFQREFEEFNGIQTNDVVDHEKWTCHTCKKHNEAHVELCSCGTPANFGIFVNQKSDMEKQKELTLKYLQEVLSDPVKAEKLQMLLKA